MCWQKPLSRALYHYAGYYASTPRPTQLAASLPPGSIAQQPSGGCGPFPEQTCPPALRAKQSKVSGRFSKAAVSGPASQSSPPAGTRMWPQQIAFAHWRLLGACLRAASPSSLNLDKVLWRKRNVWCALVFPVIVPQLALLVRFSKISCRWDYSSTLGPEACGLSVLYKNTSIRHTGHDNCGAGPDLGRGCRYLPRGRAGSQGDLHSCRPYLGACHSPPLTLRSSPSS